MFQEKRRPNTQLPTSKFFFFFFPWLGVFFPSESRGIFSRVPPRMFSFSPKRRRRKNKEEFRVFKWSSWTTSFPERLCGAVFNELPVNNVFFFLFPFFKKRGCSYFKHPSLSSQSNVYAFTDCQAKRKKKRRGCIFFSGRNRTGHSSRTGFWINT